MWLPSLAKLTSRLSTSLATLQQFHCLIYVSPLFHILGCNIWSVCLLMTWVFQYRYAIHVLLFLLIKVTGLTKDKTFAWHNKFKFSLYDFSQNDAFNTSLRDCARNPKEFVQTVMKHIGMYCSYNCIHSSLVLRLHSQHHLCNIICLLFCQYSQKTRKVKAGCHPKK